MLSNRTLEGTDLTLTTGDRVGAATHWETFEAQTPNGDPVAVRSPRGQIPESEYDRFNSLATQWQTVSTRDTVRTLLDWGTDPTPWVAVEYVPGELDALAAGSSLHAASECDLATRATLLADVCESVRSYSRYGSTPYHLRLGPESVTFREGPDGPTAVVGDWGISGLVADPPVTPYTAPEQLQQAENHAGRQTDVYRLGALGYGLFSGKTPFGDAEQPLSEAIRTGVGKLGFADVPENLSPVLRRAMALDPDDRHAGMYQLRRDVVDAKPQVPTEDRIVSVLPLSTDDPTETGESSTEPESSGSDEEPSSGQNLLSARSTVADDEKTDTTDLREISKLSMIASIVLLVMLVGGILGVTSLGLVDLPEQTLDLSGEDGGVSVSGTVTNAEGDPLAANATVELEPAEGDPMETTAEDGTFSFSDVEPGNYTLSVETDQFAYDDQEIEVTTSGIDDVTVDPDRGIVTGKVTADGNPVDATVELVDENGETVADAKTIGRFEFEVPIETPTDGSHTLRVTADGITNISPLYDQVERPLDSFGGQQPVELNSSTETTDSTESTGSLSGEVIDTTSKDPIEGAIIKTVDAEFSATTDSSGVYTIDEVPTGDYTIAVRADEYADTERPVEITPEGAEENFKLGELAEVNGVVTEVNNESNTLGNATLTLLDSNNEEVDTLTTNADGEYAFDSLAPDNYRIEVSREGYEDKMVRLINLESGQTLTRDITLTPEEVSFDIGIYHLITFNAELEAPSS